MRLLNIPTSIGQRIFTSSGAVLLLFVLTSAYNISQFSRASSSFLELEDTTENMGLIMELNTDLAELQLNILSYHDANHQSAAKRINESLGKLDSDLSNIVTRTSDQQSELLINKMIAIHAGYVENIESMRESIELERELTELTLPFQKESMFGNLVLAEELAKSFADDLLLNQIRVIRQRLLEAEIHMISFLSSRKHIDQKTALNYFGESIDLVNHAKSNPNLTEKSLDALNVVEQDIETYSTTFRKTIQAIRGSLFLTNIVMAGEAEEFSTLAAQLTSTTIDLQNALTLNVNSQVETTRTTTLYVTITTIVLGLLFALLVTRSISRPIHDISEVFRRLSLGEDEGSIPGLNRKDEIGVLAESATVFKNMNSKTKLLLLDSEKLTSDLSAREKDLQNKTLELEKSNDQLDDFAYVASHDLKSPLRAISNLSDWISEDCADILPESSKRHLEQLGQRILRMENLLSDLLKYSRVGKIEGKLEEISLIALVEEIKLMSNMPKNFEIQYPDQDIEFSTLEISLKQVMLNLFSNAFKYVEAEQGLITVDWEVGDDDYLTISIQDNGAGIEERYHEKIFKMFQTLNPRDVYEGSGMGLAIIKKVIEGVGGSIRIESSKDNGAKFIFTWPRTIAA